MSSINPYAPLSNGPDTFEARLPKETAISEVTSLTTAPEPTAVPEGSIKEILDWVNGDSTRAQQALDAENRGESSRKTLLTHLKDIISS